MKRILFPLSAVIAVAALTIPAAGSARPQTTAPGYNFNIKVSITKGGHVTMGASTAKRGWLAHFVITNKDTKPHRFSVGGLPYKKPIQPKQTVKLGSYLENRGAYKIQVDGVFRGYFTVV